MSAPRLLGAVLAGGASVRFGRDKAVEPIAGVRLVDRAADAFAEVCEDVVVVTSRPIETERATIPDLRPGRGPLAGIEAALAHASDRGFDAALVLACDLPLIRSTSLAALVSALGSEEAVAAFRDGPPGYEPLCAVYRVTCLGAARALLDEGEGAAQRLLEDVAGATIALPEDELLNVNTTEDGARADAAFEARRG